MWSRPWVRYSSQWWAVADKEKRWGEGKKTQRKEVRRRCNRGNAQRKRLYVELSFRLISRSVRSRVVAGGLTPVSPVSYPVSLSAWLISAEPQPADAVGWLIWLTARLNVSAHTAQYVLDCGARWRIPSPLCACFTKQPRRLKVITSTRILIYLDFKYYSSLKGQKGFSAHHRPCLLLSQQVWCQRLIGSRGKACQDNDVAA